MLPRTCLRVAVICIALLIRANDAKVYDRCELARELINVHGIAEEQVATWVCIATHESRLDTTAVGRLNGDGSGDHGLFQISDLFWCSPPGRGWACDAVCSDFEDDDISDDVECIKKIHNEHQRLSGNGFNAWTVYPLYCKGERVEKYVEGCFETANAIQAYKPVKRNRTSRRRNRPRISNIFLDGTVNVAPLKIGRLDSKPISNIFLDGTVKIEPYVFTTEKYPKPISNIFLDGTIKLDPYYFTSEKSVESNYITNEKISNIFLDGTITLEPEINSGQRQNFETTTYRHQTYSRTEKTTPRPAYSNKFTYSSEINAIDRRKQVTTQNYSRSSKSTTPYYSQTTPRNRFNSEITKFNWQTFWANRPTQKSTFSTQNTRQQTDKRSGNTYFTRPTTQEPTTRIKSNAQSTHLFKYNNRSIGASNYQTKTIQIPHKSHFGKDQLTSRINSVTATSVSTDLNSSNFYSRFGTTTTSPRISNYENFSQQRQSTAFGSRFSTQTSKRTTVNFRPETRFETTTVKSSLTSARSTSARKTQRDVTSRVPIEAYYPRRVLFQDDVFKFTFGISKSSLTNNSK